MRKMKIKMKYILEIWIVFNHLDKENGNRNGILRMDKKKRNQKLIL